MTVEADTSSAQYSTNGTTGPFAVPFYFLAASHLEVVYSTAAGVSTTLTLTTDYSVSGAGSSSGGSITLVTPYASGGRISIARDVPLTQLTDYVAGDAFPADAHERALDKLTMIAQQLDEQGTRALRVPEIGTLPEFPAAADRANKLVSFDSDGNPSVTAPSAGTATALAADLLDSSSITKGAALVGAGQSLAWTPGPFVANAIRNYTSPLMFAGCPVDGTSDASTYVAAALAAGRKEIIIPGDFTFVVDGLLSVPTGVRIRGEGTLKKKAGTIKHVLVLADGAQDVKIEGITIDGNRSAFSTGNAVSAIAAYAGQGLTFEDLKLNNLIDCGLKLFNCGYVLVNGGRIYNVGENGIEFKNYDVDPRTGLAYATTLPSLQGAHRLKGVWLGKIDNGTGDGSGDGCGILVSAGKLAAGTAYPVKGVTAEACHFLNVKRGFWSEQNDAGCEAEDIAVMGCYFRGDIAGFGGDVKDGIGFINVMRAKAIGNSIINVGNMNLALPATSCAGIQVSGSSTDTVELLNNTVSDNTGNTHRMDYAINLADGARIIAVGNSVLGGSDGTINVTSANVSEMVCHSNPYATGTYSWSETVTAQFTVSNLPATATTAMRPAGFTDDSEMVFPMPVRLVGMAVKMSNSPSTGTVTFKPYTNGSNISALNATNGDFSSTIAVKAISTNNGTTIAAGQRVRVDAETVGYGATTHDAIVTLTFETSFKE